MPAKQVKIRRGTTTEHSVFVGEIGEITVDTTKNTVVVHDKTLQGGNPLAKENMSNVVNSVGIQQLEVADGSANDVLTTNGMGGLSFSPINISSQLTHGGDLSGTVSNAQIVANAVGINELDVVSDGSNGQALITNGSGQLSFGNVSVAQNSIGVIELNLSDGINGQVLTTDGNANLSFQTPITNPVLGGDLSGLASNALIVNDSVNIDKLDVDDGIAGQVLSTNGSGVLSFIDADPGGGTGNTFGGGVIIGTVANANIANNAVTGAMIGPGVIVAQDIATNAVGVTELNVAADGNAGEFLQTNGAGVLSFATASSTLTGGTGVFNSIQSFEALSDNSEQTWTKPAGVTRIMYHVLGAGGSGFGGGGNATGSGGCSGSLVIGVLDVSGITSLQLRVGRGAGPSGSGSNVNTTGFNSYLGNLLGNTGAVGAAGNQGTIATGSGGQSNTPVAAIGGDLRILGTSGFSFGGGQSTAGGRGGLSHWAPFGNGGAGGGTSSDQGFGAPPTANGAGNAGIVIIFEYA